MSTSLPNTNAGQSKIRMRIVVRGAVQGVGFRPFVYRLARDLNLAGWVNNSAQGVWIEVEGDEPVVLDFLLRLEREKPSPASIQTIQSELMAIKQEQDFVIVHSEISGDKTALILPDMATCADCRLEIFDPANRRYLYPFTNCTNCGPRFTIIEALPYDRIHTSMRHFPMCSECRLEYENPMDRRFHAQPNACPNCGPHLELWDSTGNVLSQHHRALVEAACAIERGAIVAVKGLGGFHLLVDACQQESVIELRQRKKRQARPFAVMYPTMGLLEEYCFVDEVARRVLLSCASPIVLLRRKFANSPDQIALAVSPDNPYLGVMLPYTPLHHLLMAQLKRPVVATSGNISEEPICIDENEVIQRLGTIAELFLVHNRPIVRHADDSVVRIVMNKPLVLRLARGYAPAVLNMDSTVPLLALGGHMKNTVAVSVGNNILLSQHIGDLETQVAFHAFRHTLNFFKDIYELHPKVIMCDLHPDYASTRFAQKFGIPHHAVQHHYAHILACMAEHKLESPVLGVAWDGSGYGTDGTIWGGEFLSITATSFSRVAHLRAFSLPGGERAIREPRKTALGLLYEIFGNEVFNMQELAPIRSCSSAELKNLQIMLNMRLNTPHTTSVGRLFDAVASLLGLSQQLQFEGQAAMKVEFAAEEVRTEKIYSLRLDRQSDSCVVDWEPMVREMIVDLHNCLAVAEIAAKFHNTLAYSVLLVARELRERRIVLSGGCFQNKYLTESTVNLLHHNDFLVYWHDRIPPNDGCIAIGQAVAQLRASKAEER